MQRTPIFTDDAPAAGAPDPAVAADRDDAAVEPRAAVRAHAPRRPWATHLTETSVFVALTAMAVVHALDDATVG